MQLAPQQHQAMLDAISRGDREALIAECVNHLKPASHLMKVMHEIWFNGRGLAAGDERAGNGS